MNHNLRFLIPNLITFLSLTGGIVAILLAATGNLRAGGSLILLSYILDLFDGAVARRLGAGSAFGLQLDSLVDMISMGTAPAVLTFFHLRGEQFAMGWVWPLVVAFPLAGAFRLARFNLLPAKSDNNDSVGLTISTAGATLTLAVLSDIASAGELFSNVPYIPLLVMLGLLMISRIAFPPFSRVLGRQRLSYVLLLLFTGTLIWLPLVHTWFIFTGGYLAFGLARAGLQRMKAEG